jgi:hypothetical protein
MSHGLPIPISCPLPRTQKIAKIFGGLATPPGTLQTTLVTKKLHRFSFLQCSANFSRSKSSPIGIPHPARRTSWRDQDCCVAFHLSVSISQQGKLERGKGENVERKKEMGKRSNIRQHSKEGWSPATAEKFSHIHLNISSLCSTPLKTGGMTSFSALNSFSFFSFCAAMYPIS